MPFHYNSRESNRTRQAIQRSLGKIAGLTVLETRVAATEILELIPQLIDDPDSWTWSASFDLVESVCSVTLSATKKGATKTWKRRLMSLPLSD